MSGRKRDNVSTGISPFPVALEFVSAGFLFSLIRYAKGMVA